MKQFAVKGILRNFDKQFNYEFVDGWFDTKEQAEKQLQGIIKDQPKLVKAEIIERNR